MNGFMEKYEEKCNIVETEIETALENVDTNALERLCDDISSADKIFLTGVGRVLLSLEAFAKRLTHLGITAHCVGDITEPAITDKDILIVASGSGESIVPVVIAKKAKELNAKKIIHIGSNPNGAVAQYIDYMVRIPVQTRYYLEDEIKSRQIMTSLFEQTMLLLGDIIAMIIVEDNDIDMMQLWHCHANLE